MNNVSLSKELNSLNGVDKVDFLNVSNYIEDILSSNILRSIKNGDNEVVFDIGIGELTIRVFLDSIYYDFKPSISLQEKVMNSSNKDENYLVSSLNDKISLKLYKIFREILK